MSEYFKIRRQFFAFLAGAIVAIPLSITAAVILPSTAPPLNAARASETVYGPFLLMFSAGAHVASFVAALFNYFGLRAFGFVAASLVFDVHKLRSWRNSKSIALCIGVVTLCASCCGFGVQEDYILPALALFLGSGIGLTAIFITLLVLRSLGRENAVISRSVQSP